MVLGAGGWLDDLGLNPYSQNIKYKLHKNIFLNHID